MGKPVIHIRLSATADAAPNVKAPSWVAPATIASTPLAEQIKKDNPPQDPSLSPLTLSVEGEARDLLRKVCDSKLCQNWDAGGRVGWRFDLGSLPLSLHLQKRFPLEAKSPTIAPPTDAQQNEPSTISQMSVVTRVSLGVEKIWGDVYSVKDVGRVDIDGSQFHVDLAGGVDALFTNKYPVQALLGIRFDRETNLEHGYVAEGGPMLFLSISGGLALFGSKGGAGTTETTEAESETASVPVKRLPKFELGPASLQNAMAAQTTGSHLPVFLAMHDKLAAFTLNATSLSEYNNYLNQMADGIAVARFEPGEAAKAVELLVDAWQKAKSLGGTPHKYLIELTQKLHLLAGSDIGVRNKVAGIYDIALTGTRSATDEAAKHAHVSAIFTVLNTFHFPMLRQGVNDYQDAADTYVEELLLMTVNELPSDLPEVLRTLVETGKDLALVKGKKKALLDAAQKIGDKKERAAVTKLIKSSIK